MLQVANSNTNIHPVLNSLTVQNGNQFVDNSSLDSYVAPTATDAIRLITADHHYLIRLLVVYENSAEATEKSRLVTEICTELLVHSQVKETIFYPVVENALLKNGEILDEPIIEHAGLVALIAEVEHNLQIGKNYEIKLKILAEYIKYQIQQEREIIFPILRATAIDLKRLGQELALAKLTLMRGRHYFISEKTSKLKGLS